MCQSKENGGERCQNAASAECRETANAQRREKYAEDKFLIGQNKEHADVMAEAWFTRNQLLADIEDLDALKANALQDPENTELGERVRKASLHAELATNLVNEKAVGRLHDIALLTVEDIDSFDTAQKDSLVENAILYKHYYAAKMTKNAKDFTTPVTAKAWKKFIDGLAENLAKDGNEATTEQLAALETLYKADTLPDLTSFKAYGDVASYKEKAISQQENQYAVLGALRDVEPAMVKQYYDAYRQQYINTTVKPELPSTWVRGDFVDSGLMVQRDSCFVPSDPASLYANFRIRGDKDAIAKKHRGNRLIASIDIETAGNNGEGIHAAAAFIPARGKIIEVGITTYTQSGKKVEEYSSLYRPDDEFLALNGTGAVEVHNITVSDLDGAPTWESEQAEVFNRLNGHIVLAQNYDFERNWLSEHCPGFADAKLPYSDTLEQARVGLNLPAYKLQRICSEVGVPYLCSHRAFADAVMTLRAYFKVQNHMETEWASDPVRAEMPALTL